MGCSSRTRGNRDRAVDSYLRSKRRSESLALRAVRAENGRFALRALSSVQAEAAQTEAQCTTNPKRSLLLSPSTCCRQPPLGPETRNADFSSAESSVYPPRRSWVEQDGRVAAVDEREKKGRSKNSPQRSACLGGLGLVRRRRKNKTNKRAKKEEQALNGCVLNVSRSSRRPQRHGMSSRGGAQKPLRTRDWRDGGLDLRSWEEAMRAPRSRLVGGCACLLRRLRVGGGLVPAYSFFVCEIHLHPVLNSSPRPGFRRGGNRNRGSLL